MVYQLKRKTPWVNWILICIDKTCPFDEMKKNGSVWLSGLLTKIVDVLGKYI